MKEQVKEWIVDKNLTIDSFDNIMIGVIYNSRHNTLDDPDVREWIGMHPNEFREMLPPNLNENQQIVLRWLKNYAFEEAITPIDTVGVFWKERNFMGQPPKWRMTGKQQAQVLQAFSQWALEKEEEKCLDV